MPIPDLKNELPKNWIWTNLKDIGNIASGGTPSTKVQEYYNGNIAWVTPADLTNYNEKFISRGKRNISNLGLNSSSARLLPKGTILFSSRAPIGYVVISSNPIATNQGFKNFIPSEVIFNEYVYYYLKYAKGFIESMASGTTFKEISARVFANISIPLPPLPEQHRIVTKIEELFSDLDAGVAALKKAKSMLEIYRQAVLKAGFKGEFTNEWRKKNYIKSKSIIQLLERLSAERNLYEQKNLMENNGGKKSSKTINTKKISPLRESEIKDLPKLPEGWFWLRNDELLAYVTSGSRDWKKYYSKYGSLFIRTQDINTNRLDFSKIAHVNLPEKIEGKRSRVEKYDLLMTITGANVGKVAYVDSEIPETYVSQSVALMKYFNKRIVKFLHLYFQTEGYGMTFIKKMVYGMGRPVLSLLNMRDVPIPLCSFEEQELIIRAIENRLNQIEKIRTTIEVANKNKEIIKQSILKKAFSGKLVHQNPDDEPAEKLLRRIYNLKL